MIVHLYAQFWNDEWMLPYFFRHYDFLVDRYYLFDDGSTDSGPQICRGHPKVELATFPRGDSRSFVLSEQQFSDECWKRSRGVADWVIVTDVDEHLYHPDGRSYLERCAGDGITMIPALGFQMISDRVPAPHETLSETCRIGAPWKRMMKASIFDPDAVAEVRFAPGRHRADPLGTVRVPEVDEMLLFHYKYIGFERTHRRHMQLRNGLGADDLLRGWGHKYMWSKDQLREDWARVGAEAVDARALEPPLAETYPIAPWWEKYRTGR